MKADFVTAIVVHGSRGDMGITGQIILGKLAVTQQNGCDASPPTMPSAC